jgi:hypothetical protein
MAVSKGERSAVFVLRGAIAPRPERLAGFLDHL